MWIDGTGNDNPRGLYQIVEPMLVYPAHGRDGEVLVHAIMRKVVGPACTIDLKTEKPIPGRYLANDSDLVAYLKGRGVLVEIGDDDG